MDGVSGCMKAQGWGPIQNWKEYHVPKKRGQEGGLKLEKWRRKKVKEVFFLQKTLR